MPNMEPGDGASITLDTDKRVTRAEELLCEQYTGRQIVRKLCDEFGVVERTAYSYLKVAYENMQSGAAEERAIRKTRARATWQAQYRKCLTAKDFSAANYALDRLCKLDGLFAPTKHKVEVGGSITVGIQIRNVMSVLDARGIEAMAVVLEQLEAAKQKGLLVEEPVGTPALPEGVDPDSLIDVDEPKPAPAAKVRGRKPRTKA